MNSRVWFVPVMVGAMVVGGGCAQQQVDDPDAAMAVMSIGYGNIPSNALRVSSGKGILRFRVDREGTVWVGDDSARKELLEMRVLRDDVVEVDAYSNAIRLNGEVVSTPGLDRTHRHSIFYLDARKKPRGGGS